MKIITSIIFSLVVAVFAVKANNQRHQSEFDQIQLDQVRMEARGKVRKEHASREVERLLSVIEGGKEIVILSTNPAEQALAIEDLRESRAELRRYQSQLSR